MGYIPSPDEAIADNQIRMARAEQKAADNVWTKYVIPIGSQLLTSAIKGGAFSGAGGAAGGAGGADAIAGSSANGISENMRGFNIEDYITQQGDASLSGPIAALGKNNAEGDIEVEGGEVLDMNGMDPVEIQGARHEQGGVDVTVPSGTKIFSDRLKGPDGKTMAERKKRREGQMKKIEDILSDNSTDLAVKNAYERKKNVVEQEEAQDLMMQQMADAYDKLRANDMYAGGTGPNGTDPRYGNFSGIQYSKGYNLNQFQPFLQNYVDSTQNTSPDWGDINNRKAFQKMIGTKEDGIFGPDTLAKAQAYYSNRQQPAVSAVPEIDTGASPNLASAVKGIASPTSGANTGEVVQDASVSDTGRTTDKPSLATGDYNNTGRGADSNARGNGNEDLPEQKWKDLIPNMTGGDLLSLYGNFLGATDPLDNVLENRAGDQPNINHFRNFGKDALEALENEKGYVEGQKSQALMKLMLSNAASKKSMRGSARGVNTLRALDLAADLNKDIAGNDVQNNFAQQMMQIFGQQAQLENQQDQMVMSGEERRDLADRQDRDQYYTNKGIALNAKSKGIQEMGRDVNKLYENQREENLINQIGKYFEYDKNGNLKNIKSKKEQQLDSKNSKDRVDYENFINPLTKKHFTSIDEYDAFLSEYYLMGGKPEDLKKIISK